MQDAPRLPALEGLSDDELRELVKRAQALLHERDREKRQQAVREIERLAKEHGIELEVKGQRKRRGRRPKPKGGGDGERA